MLDSLYTSEYVQAQLKKHINRYENHWKNHIYWAKKMVNDYWGDRPATLLDLGCSVGTYAIEFAIEGFVTMGLDLDPKALKVASEMAAKENVKPEWICENAKNFVLPKPIDIILCFDLLEHLDDQTIRGMLRCIKQNLNPEGIFVYHTFPTEYDHIFYKNEFFRNLSPKIPLPLIPFKKFNDSYFTHLVRIYSNLLNLFSIIIVGKTYKGIIKKTVHPSPLSQKKLDEFLQEAGLESIYSREGIEDFNPLKPDQGKLALKHFSNKTVAQRSLWGVSKIYLQ